MPSPLLEVRGLCKTYTESSGQSQVLQNITFLLNKGESLSLTGPSGSGKSTLLHLLGLLDRPTSGDIILEGENSSSWSTGQRERARAKNIGFVFQKHMLLPEFKLWENVALPLIKDRGFHAQAEKKARSFLERMQLDHRANAFPAHLSGGELQRGAICRALIHEPKLVLMDEPTGNLDPTLGFKVMNDVLTMMDELHITCILVTHNFDLAHLAKRMARLEDHQFLELPVEKVR